MNKYVHTLKEALLIREFEYLTLKVRKSSFYTKIKKDFKVKKDQWIVLKTSWTISIDE